MAVAAKTRKVPTPNEWKAPAGVVSLVREADQMHALLVQRADQLGRCCGGPRT